MSKVTEQRKEEHININQEKNVQFPRLTTQLERFRFPHRALPELDLKKISTQTSLLGKTLDAPIFISSMTGGTDRAREINYNLAQVAQKYNLAIGVGSQRVAIENAQLADTFQLRKVAPDVLLFANLGAVQLNYGYGLEQCQQAVEMIEANALILHFNPLQEAIQPEGDTNFTGLVDKVSEICAKLPVPVIAKEVGWGFSPQDIKLLLDAGVSIIDVAGAGGTSWSEVESHRTHATNFQKQLAQSFANWGIPTAKTIGYVKNIAPQLTVFASGGIQDGVDAAKCIALGASLVGLAGAFIKIAEKPEQIYQQMEILLAQFKIAMFCAGVGSIEALAQLDLIEDV